MQRTSIRIALVTSLAVVAALTQPAQAQQSAMVPESAARHLGLTRSWFTQVERTVEHVTYEGGTLFVQNNQATVHALDAETGREFWSARFGNHLHPSMAPAANSKFVALINGSFLYILDRQTGNHVWKKRLGGSPGAGAALSKTHVFVPMVNGTLEAYNLEDFKDVPWVYRSVGRTLVQPMVTPRTVSWTTNRGYMYVSNTEELGVKLRLETTGAVESRPAYWTPHYYAGSHDGFVYAVNERSGITTWKFSSGDPIFEPPVAIDGRVFITPDMSGMFCLDGQSGRQLWFAPSITRVAAVSPTRIYAFDRYRRLVSLDVKTGGVLAIMPLAGTYLKVLNIDTDRIYLVSGAGTVQCLHELELKEPVKHVPPPPATKKKEVQQKGLDSAGENDPAAKPLDNPFGDGEMKKDAAPAVDNPFADPAGEKKPEAKPADNPFG